MDTDDDKPDAKPTLLERLTAFLVAPFHQEAPVGVGQ